jgi:hypothetical protein
VHGGTWQSVLDLSSLRLAGIEIDSGAGKVECTLPMPVGPVPVRINSGIMKVRLHRPRAAALHAMLHSGSVKLRLDQHLIRTVMADTQWETPNALQQMDRFELTVHSGCMDVSVDAAAPLQPPPPAAPAAVQPPKSGGDSVVDLILDGIERRI